MKYCKQCERWVDNTEFYKSKITKDGLHSWCKACCKVYAKGYQKKYRQTPKGKAAVKKYNNSDKARAASSKYAASDKGKEYHRNYHRKYRSTPESRAASRAYAISPKRKAYRKAQMTNFVYRMICTANGRAYFGSSTVIPCERFAKHRYDLRHNTHSNPDVQDDFNQYGLDAFEFDVLEEFDKIESVDLRTREQYYIDSYQGEVYNLIMAVANG